MLRFTSKDFSAQLISLGNRSVIIIWSILSGCWEPHTRNIYRIILAFRRSLVGFYWLVYPESGLYLCIYIRAEKTCAAMITPLLHLNIQGRLSVRLPEGSNLIRSQCLKAASLGMGSPLGSLPTLAYKQHLTLIFFFWKKRDQNHVRAASRFYVHPSRSLPASNCAS